MADIPDAVLDRMLERMFMRLHAKNLETREMVTSVLENILAPDLSGVAPGAVPTDSLDHNGLLNLTTGDPHTQYQKESEKGVASGYAGLDSGTHVPQAQLGSGSAGAGAKALFDDQTYKTISSALQIPVPTPTDPTTTGWTNVFTTAGFFDSGFGDEIRAGGGTGANKLQYRRRAFTSPGAFNEYEIYLRAFILDTGGVNSAFIGFRESATNKFLLIHFEPDGKLSVKRWTNDTTIASTVITSRPWGGDIPAGIDLQYDPGGLDIYWSLIGASGSPSILLYNEAANAHFTTEPDQLVWGVNSVTAGNGVGIYAYLQHFLDYS